MYGLFSFDSAQINSNNGNGFRVFKRNVFDVSKMFLLSLAVKENFHFELFKELMRQSPHNLHIIVVNLCLKIIGI